MFHLIRPTIAYLLCMLLALGQLPALLHVASCHPPRTSVSASSLSRSSGCARHCCQCAVHSPSKKRSSAFRSAVRSGDRNDGRLEEGQQTPVEHDSDGCCVCRSLLLHSIVCVFEFDTKSEICCLDFLLLRASCLGSRVLWSTSAPRGPPLDAGTDFSRQA